MMGGMMRAQITNDLDWPVPRSIDERVTDDMVERAYAVLYPVESWPDRLIATGAGACSDRDRSCDAG